MWSEFCVGLVSHATFGVSIWHSHAGRPPYIACSKHATSPRTCHAQPRIAQSHHTMNLKAAFHSPVCVVLHARILVRVCCFVCPHIGTAIENLQCPTDACCSLSPGQALRQPHMPFAQMGTEAACEDPGRGRRRPLSSAAFRLVLHITAMRFPSTM